MTEKEREIDRVGSAARKAEGLSTREGTSDGLLDLTRNRAATTSCPIPESI